MLEKFLGYFTIKNKKSEENLSVKEVLKKFKHGNYIENLYELKILQRYASTGMVSFGFDYEKKECDAKLTPQGKWFVKQL